MGMPTPVAYKLRRGAARGLLARGMNFAVGGAGVLDTGNFQRNISAQIDLFQAQQQPTEARTRKSSSRFADQIIYHLLINLLIDDGSESAPLQPGFETYFEFDSCICISPGSPLLPYHIYIRTLKARRYIHQPTALDRSHVKAPSDRSIDLVRRPASSSPSSNV